MFTLWLPVSMPPGCFPLTFPHSGIGVFPFPNREEKGVGRWMSKRVELKWRWELKVNTRGWSVTLNTTTPLTPHVPLSLVASSLSHSPSLPPEARDSLLRFLLWEYLSKSTVGVFHLYVNICMWVTHSHPVCGHDLVYVGHQTAKVLVHEVTNSVLCSLHTKF